MLSGPADGSTDLENLYLKMKYKRGDHGKDIMREVPQETPAQELCKVAHMCKLNTEAVPTPAWAI